jgi:hypothetical protein
VTPYTSSAASSIVLSSLAISPSMGVDRSRTAVIHAPSNLSIAPCPPVAHRWFVLSPRDEAGDPLPPEATGSVVF